MQKHIQIISTFIWGNNARMKSFDLFLSAKFLLCHNFDEGPKTEDRQTDRQTASEADRLKNRRSNRNTENAKSNMTARANEANRQRLELPVLTSLSRLRRH